MKKFFVVSTLAFLFFFAGCDSKKKVETDEDVQVEVEADVGSSDGTVEATDGTDSTDGTDATDVVPEPVDADAGSVDAADLPDAASPASLPDDATGA
jgi:hypothetical protein